MPSQVLIADGVATNRIVLKTKLAMACYSVSGFGTWEELETAALSGEGQVIILDAGLPTKTTGAGPRDAVEMCLSLKTDPRTAAIPLVLTLDAQGEEERAALRRAARAAGVDAVMEKPLDDTLLLARIRNLLRNRDIVEELRLRDTTTRALGFAETSINYEAPGIIALVAPHLEDALELRRNLRAHSPDKLLPLTPGMAISNEYKTAPDIYLILALPGEQSSALRLMADLRSREASRHAGMLMLMRERNSDAAATALDMGASDVLINAVDFPEIALSITAQLRTKRRADRLRLQVKTGLQMAVRDPLTGLYNRRYALSHLARIQERSALSGRPYAVMMLDLDRFKSVNDAHGHAAGDAVLKAVSDRLNENLRGVDLIARIGGEEFMVVMPDTEQEAAHSAAKRLCAQLKDRPIPLACGTYLTQTVSIGVAMGGATTEIALPEETVDRADRALLTAKSRGRNMVRLQSTAA